MRRPGTPALLILLLAPLALLSCDGPPSEMAADLPLDAPSMEMPVPEAPVAEMEGAEKAFFVTLPSGEKITVGVFPNPDWPGKKLAFDRPVAKTDRNIYPVARTSMWEVYGRQRGHFGPGDMSVAVRGDLGRVVMFKTSTGGRLGVFPLLDDQGSSMEGMYLWME